MVIEASSLVPLVDVLPKLSNRGRVGVHDIGAALQSMGKVRFGLHAGPDGAPLYVRADQGHSGGVVDPMVARGAPLTAEEARELPRLSHRAYERCCASIVTHKLLPGGTLGGLRRAAVRLTSCHRGTRYWTTAQEGRPDCDATAFIDPAVAAAEVDKGNLLLFRTPQNVVLC